MYLNNQEDLCEGKFIDKNIDKVVFGPNIKSIPENCFNGCNNLKEIVFEGNINNIEAAAFMNCDNLQTINANNIGIIKDFAFHGCDNIINFNIKENIANNIKYGINNNILSTYFVLPEIGTPLNDISWQKIDLISRKDKAKKYFKVGDEKALIIKEYDYLDYDWMTKTENVKTHHKTKYHIQILGFNHDDKSDGTGKAGITVGLKEIMTTEKVMNSSDSNIGGWEQSEMRTYLQNDVLTSLPSDLQSVIKTVNKKSDIGNKDKTTLNTTEDKLFLLSLEEVGESHVCNVVGQGTKYDYFTDNTSRTKKYLTNSSGFWWLRSANSYNTNYFYSVNSNGYYSYNIADSTRGVVFGFSI